MTLMLKIRRPFCETLGKSYFVLQNCEQLTGGENGKCLARKSFSGKVCILSCQSLSYLSKAQNNLK